MKNMVAEGEKLSLTAPYDVLSGAGMKVGNIFAVAENTALSGVLVTGVVEGVFDLTKKSGDTFAVGDYAYWDNTNKYITSTSSGNTKVGVATVIAAGGDAVVRVRLNEAF